MRRFFAAFVFAIAIASAPLSGCESSSNGGDGAFYVKGEPLPDVSQTGCGDKNLEEKAGDDASQNEVIRISYEQGVFKVFHENCLINAGYDLAVNVERQADRLLIHEWSMNDISAHCACRMDFSYEIDWDSPAEIELVIDNYEIDGTRRGLVDETVDFEQENPVIRDLGSSDSEPDCGHEG